MYSRVPSLKRGRRIERNTDYIKRPNNGASRAEQHGHVQRTARLQCTSARDGYQRKVIALVHYLFERRGTELLKSLFIVFQFVFTLTCLGANHYIRQGGTGNGSDWANACNGFSGS